MIIRQLCEAPSVGGVECARRLMSVILPLLSQEGRSRVMEAYFEISVRFVNACSHLSPKLNIFPIYVCVYECAYMHECMYAGMKVYINVCWYLYAHICRYAGMKVYMYVCMTVPTCMCISM